MLRAIPIILALGCVGTLVFGQTADIRLPARLDQLQFKATHNSYRLKDLPHIQIDKYDVWEIELDFGMPYESRQFIVGHDGPEPRHGLCTLGEWVQDVLKAESRSAHPIIIKLEAKTRQPCGQLRYPTFQCVTGWGKDWQSRLRDSLAVWIGYDNLITPSWFRDTLAGKWPDIHRLAGKVIVTLQDSNYDRDIDTASSFFFGRVIPVLKAVWPPIKNENELEVAIKSKANRLTLDEGYAESWARITR